MTKLIDHTFNYLRVALLGVVVAFLIIGPNAAAVMQNDQVNDPKLWIPTDSMYSTETANYSPVYTMSFGNVWSSFVDFWKCVLDNSAQCSMTWGIACTAASALIVTSLIGLTSAGAVAGLASQMGKKFVRKTIDKIKKLLDKWGVQTITIGGVTFNIPWSSLSSLLDDDNYWGKALDFLMLNDYSKAKRICKCLIC